MKPLTRGKETNVRKSPRLLDLANALVARETFGATKVHTTKDFGSGEKLVEERQRAATRNAAEVGLALLTAY